MTDLKRALRAFDDVSPDDAVLRRARGGPTRATPTGRPRGERVVAGVTAVAVFAAGVLFAWSVVDRTRTEEPGPTPEPPADVVAVGADGSILWPERTAAELVRSQRAADDGTLRWRLDPEAVAHEFAERVLGWWPHDTYALAMEGDGSPLVTHLVRDERTCPSPGPDDEDRGVPPCIPGAQDVTLVQPVTGGPTGIWAVSGVRAPSASLDLVPGQIVTNGETVSAHVDVPEGRSASWTVAIGEFGGEEPCFGSSFGRVSGPVVSIEVSILSDAEMGTECGATTQGYVAIQISKFDASANPLNADSSPYVAVTAVPIVLSVPENETPVGVSVHEDAMGWRIAHPSGWTVASASDERGSRVWISNAPIFEGSPVESVVPPADAVVLSVVPAEDQDDVRDDSAFPLSIFDFGSVREPGLFQLRFRGNGVTYEAELVVGESVGDEDFARMGDVITSLRFVTIPAGQQRNGWLSLGRTDPPGGRGVPIWAGGPFGVGYLLDASFGPYLLDLEPDSCGEGQNQTWDAARGQILVECPDGTEIRYERTGEAVPGNPPAFTQPLRAFRVITAWDGTLLVRTDGPIGLGATLDD
jgi:hypothetical protein